MCNPFLILNKWCIFASGKNFPYIVIIAQCIVFFVRTVAVYREPLQFNCFWEVYQLEELTERVRRFIIIPLEGITTTFHPHGDKLALIGIF